MEINHIIRQLEEMYNPEKDLIPDAPSVTYTDRELLDCIKFLLTRVDDLEKRVNELEYNHN
jgi:hypothetical protein